MRRNHAYVAFGVILTGAFVSGLAAMRRWERLWSEDPATRIEQILFVAVLAILPIAVFAIDRRLRRPRARSPVTDRLADELPDDFEDAITKP